MSYLIVPVDGEGLGSCSEGRSICSRHCVFKFGGTAFIADTEAKKTNPMSRKEHYFFSTFDDISAVLEDIETRSQLKFIRSGMFLDNERPVFSAFRDLPELGYSASGETALNPKYLVSRPDYCVTTVQVPQRNGGIMHSVDNWTNQESIVFAPGGLHEASGAVIEGRITLNHSNETSLELYTLFLNSFKRKFRAVRGNLVGDNAYAILESGGRLTQRIRGSADYDLHL